MSNFSYNEVEIDDEYLLNLTGIRALHPQDEISTSLVYEVVPDIFTDELVVVKIRSEYFAVFNVRIDIRFKKIENQLIISTGIQPRVSELCLRYQADFAIAEQYSYINIIALKRDYELSYNGYKTKLFGHSVWGKYGFLMINEKNIRDFVDLMESHEMNFRVINEIYDGTVEGNFAKVIWKNSGNTWPGKFTLNKKSDSYKILNELRK